MKTKQKKVKVIASMMAMTIALWIGAAVPAFAQHEGHGGASPSPKAQPAEQPKAQTQEPGKASEEAAVVEVPLDKQQMIGLKTVAVSARPLRKTIRTIGRVEYDERKLAAIAPKFEGWIEKLFVDYTGMRVRKGEPLAEIYSPELFATQQEFINLLKWRSQDGAAGGNQEFGRMLARDNDAIIEAARQRLRLWDITDEQIREIEITGKAAKTMTLVSPVDGTVTQKTAVLGMRFMPGEKLFDIADLSTVWIMADVYEYELPLIREGDTARISLSYFPGKELTARVEYISPTLSAETRTAKVRFSVPNPEGRLKPQMFTNVEMKINMGSRLAIPEDAVIDTGERQIVYVDKGEGYFEPREVTLGLRADGMVEVSKGLRAGERVASSANFLIDSEARLKGIVK